MHLLELSLGGCDLSLVRVDLVGPTCREGLEVAALPEKGLLGLVPGRLRGGYRAAELVANSLNPRLGLGSR